MYDQESSGLEAACGETVTAVIEVFGTQATDVVMCLNSIITLQIDVYAIKFIITIYNSNNKS